jgi:hypothetical protein
MSAKKRSLTLAVLLLGALIVFAADESNKSADRMRRKLEHSQKVLEGIALADFKAIERHAAELLQISKEAGWKVLKTPEYTRHSEDFARSAEALMKNAKDRNIDGAALSYIEMTRTCVKCHKHVRDERMASRD